MSLIMQERLLTTLSARARGITVADVRVGLAYTAVALDNGHAGLAGGAAAADPQFRNFELAGTLAGSPAERLLAMLVDENSALARAVGLATANALLSMPPRPAFTDREVTSAVDITAEDRVAMVGYFAPVVSRLRRVGCLLDIIELDERYTDTVGPSQGAAYLAECTVALITGTTLVNGTCDEVLASLGAPRAAVLLGPSSPLCPELLREGALTHIAGSRVHNADAVLRLVSEGGGTKLMRPYLDFEIVQAEDDVTKLGDGQSGDQTGA